MKSHTNIGQTFQYSHGSIAHEKKKAEPSLKVYKFNVNLPLFVNKYDICSFLKMSAPVHMDLL